MKINLNKSRNKGISLWIVLLFILFVVFILGVAYIIVTAIQEWFEQYNRPNKEDEVGMYDTWKQDMEESGHTFTNPIAVTWTSTAEVDEVYDKPLSISTTNNLVSLANMSPATIYIQRSTNLIYWETIAEVIGSGDYTDTNMPYPTAFYRRIWATNNITP